MNDRLAELTGDLPSWANEGDDNGNFNDGDIELGSSNNKNKKKDNNEDDDIAWGSDDAASSKDNNAAATTTSSQPEHMKQFFNDVEAIKLDISTVTSATEQITSLKDKAVLATSETEESQISDTIRTLVESTNKRAKTCKNLLGLLKQENANLKEKKEITATDLRVRENLVNTLLRKFIDEMKRYQNSQQQYKTDVKKKVTRQVQMIKPDATDQEVDDIMRSEGGREALYQQQILSGGVNDQIKTQYRQVAGKYQDVLTLEASVAELHQMFLDFALLTEQQGELLDQIEYQVRSAADYVEDANVDVYEAIEYQKKIRKKQCWILLIVVVVIIVVLFSSGIIP
jgi:t-SNARE complex subunit (syntaxin)|mmetsp:Transcript_19645/g.42298  ORF Transcript_19645/g.42298 Transcript_19645/m.42298 type:complete len:342 (+) Transcript_19645:328-1353(+)|eukprot:scaffold1727_cov198-Alexandrium_tamarense.AAC.13